MYTERGNQFEGREEEACSDKITIKKNEWKKERKKEKEKEKEKEKKRKEKKEQALRGKRM